MPPTSRQDDFQFRLVQWLLDQLNSHRELEIVTQQITLLISQIQEPSIEDLYLHIGKIIFQKTAQIQPEGSESRIKLFAELCYSLSVTHFKQILSLSPRVVLIHEHLFRLCIDSLSTGNTVESSNDTSGWNNNKISVKNNSELLLGLWHFQLVSLVQICEYIFRVIEAHKTFLGPSGASSWKIQAATFREWVDTHSSSNGDGNTVIGPRIIKQRQGLDAVTEEDTLIKHRSPPLGHSSDPSSPVSSNESLLSDFDEEGKMDNMTRNNFGSPPLTPLTKPVANTRPRRKRVPMSVATDTEKPSPVDIMTSSPEATVSVEGITQSVSSSSAGGVKKVPPSHTQPALANTAPVMASASTTVLTAPVVDANPTPSKQKKVNVHALFLGGGMPPEVTTNPTAGTAPSVSTRARPLSWGPTGYYPPHYYNSYGYWGGHLAHEPAYMPPVHQQPTQLLLQTQSLQSHSSPTLPPASKVAPRPLPSIMTTTTETRPNEPSPSSSTISPSIKTIEERYERLGKEREAGEKAVREREKKDHREMRGVSRDDELEALKVLLPKDGE
ncbi:hypothetical protein OPQ81_010621 [Rhizoctonia solani]|nr:hypothetical protein OPQ81_010621 [Rhizoctonia solani]